LQQNPKICTEIERLNAKMEALDERAGRMPYGDANERLNDRAWVLQQQIMDLGKQAVAMPAFSDQDIRDKAAILRVYLPSADEASPGLDACNSLVADVLRTAP